MDWIDEIEARGYTNDLTPNDVYLLLAEVRRLAAYEDTGLEPDEINTLHERLNAEDAKVGKWPVFVPGSTFHGANIVGADYEHKTVMLDWSEDGGANE